MKRIFFISFLLFPALFHAQKQGLMDAWMVTNKGDTVQGQVKVQEFNYRSIPFRAARQEKWEQLKPEDFAKIERTDRVQYVSHRIVSQKDTIGVLAISLVAGPYSLYQTQNENGFFIYYINSPNKPELSWVNFRAMEIQFRNYFGDCATTYKGKIRYSEQNLVSFVRKMNDCAYPQAASPKLEKPKIPFMISGGLSLNVQQMAGYIGAFHGWRSLTPTFPKTTRLSGGITTQLQAGNFLALRTGLQYFDASMSMDSLQKRYTRRDPPFYYPVEVYETYASREHFKFKYLEVPLLITVSPFFKYHWKPFIGAGVAFVFPIVSEGYSELRPIPNDGSLPQVDPFVQDWNFIAGVQRSFHRLTFECSLSYHMAKVKEMFVLDQGFPYPINNNRMQIGVSVLYKLMDTGRK